jgi:arginine decarboxylase
MEDAAKAIKAGRELVSALFVIPYPPGFPILVPGQIVIAAILEFMAALDVREIHGFRPELGFRIFNKASLARVDEATAARSALAAAGRTAFPVERGSQTVTAPAEQQTDSSSIITTARIES